MASNTREIILREIEGLQIKQDNVLVEIEKLRNLGKDQLAEKLDKTEYRRISYEILSKWEQYTQSLENDYGNKILSIADLFSMNIPEQS